MQRLRDELQAENVYLRREERERLGLTRVIGQSAAVRRVLEQIQQVAPTDATVLLLGETGTGKELFAHADPRARARAAAAPMVRVNCAAIPATLIESELFGREKGAFTGALARQIGRFELADHSTIFLDEIGDLPLDVQVKLLRVLEERTDRAARQPAADPRRRADHRRDAPQSRAARRATARSARTSTTASTSSRFTCRRCASASRTSRCWSGASSTSSRKAFGKRIDSIDEDSLAALQQYPWPGNVRELRNVVERAMIVAHRPAADDPVAARRRRPRRRRSPKLVDVETRAHPRASSRAPAGGFAAPAAPPTGSA